MCSQPLLIVLLVILTPIIAVGQDSTLIVEHGRVIVGNGQLLDHAKLEGKLLLAHGELDENVHPAQTMRLVNALIAAGRDFDLLLMPNRGHGLNNDPYFLGRRWGYFVQHLLGDQLPEHHSIRQP